MKTVEEISEAGLVVVRGAIEPVLIDDYAQECEALFGSCLGEYEEGQVEGSPGSIRRLTHKDGTTRIREMGFSAITEVLESLEIPAKSTLVVNSQDPYSFQRFHNDLYKSVPLVVIHASGNGAFDYMPGQFNPQNIPDESQANTVETGPGDVIYQYQPTMLHRGLNRGETSRITTVSY